MRSPELAVSATDSADSLARNKSVGAHRAVWNMVKQALTAAELEVRKLRHDRMALFSRAVQPVLWLLVFGQVFSRLRAVPTGDLRYIDFMTPGILAQSVLFISIFNGISVIWERDLGTLHKLLVSPAPRAALVLGKGAGGAVRSAFQVLIVIVLALLLGVKLNFHPLALAGTIFLVALGASLFSTLSLIIACLVKTRERFMGIGQLMTMPMFFASNAIYPISIMPDWLQVVARVNPLSYLVEGLRTLVLTGGPPALHGLGMDVAVLLAIHTVLVLIAARLYPRLGM